VDLARGLAVFGMYAAHVGPDPSEGAVLPAGPALRLVLGDAVGDPVVAVVGLDGGVDLPDTTVSPGSRPCSSCEKAGAAHYSTVKTVKSGTHGNLSTKVTATAAASWRWYFPGTTTTARIVSAGDAVALKK
jgi:hypothetical protein